MKTTLHHDRVLAHLDVSSVVVCVFDVREPVSGRFGKVLRLRNKPQQLGPTCSDRETKRRREKFIYVNTQN